MDVPAVSIRERQRLNHGLAKGSVASATGCPRCVPGSNCQDVQLASWHLRPVERVQGLLGASMDRRKGGTSDIWFLQWPIAAFNADRMHAQRPDIRSARSVRHNGGSTAETNYWRRNTFSV